jgi:hypothetical protein
MFVVLLDRLLAKSFWYAAMALDTKAEATCGYRMFSMSIEISLGLTVLLLV